MQFSAVLALFVCGLSAYSFISRLRNALTNSSKLKAIPTIGPSGILTSYYGAYMFMTRAREMIQKGYDQYNGGIFKVPTFSGWLVVATGPQMVDDMRKANDSQLSSKLGMVEVTKLDRVIGSHITEDRYNAHAVVTLLTRSIGPRMPDIIDELLTSLQTLIPPRDDWVKVPLHKTILRMVCRITNRFLVGLPLCQDPDFIALGEMFAIEIIKASYIMRLFPKILDPIVGRLLTKVPSCMERALKHLGPVIQNRLDQEIQHGSDWPGKPNDLIAWMLQTMTEEEKASPDLIHDISLGVLVAGLASIHTTSAAVSQAVLDLARFPEYVPELREEVESIIATEGWGKAATEKMHKLDSFIKESQRFFGLGVLTMTRKVLKDFTFSNGIVIPEGCVLNIASFPMHHDEGYFTTPDQFDGFRFSNMPTSESNSTAKHQLISLESTFLLFGHGRSACPGRHLAVNEMKAMLGHILLNYDIKLENEEARPLNLWFGAYAVPNPSISVSFRKRSS